MLKVSGTIEAYSIVTLKGDKLVRANKRTRNPYGVFYPFSEEIIVKTRLFNGKLNTISMNVPAGIRVYGPSKCLIGMEEIKHNNKVIKTNKEKK